MEKFSSEIKNYFDSLPSSLQETILQSGARFDTRQQMESFVNAVKGEK